MAAAGQGPARATLHAEHGPQAQPSQQGSKIHTCCMTVLRGVSHIYLLLGFMPMLVVAIMADISLLLAFGVSVAIAVFTLCITRILQATDIFAVWPKSLDCFNLLLYSVALPIAATQPHWMHRWLQVWTTGGTCLFMWVSILASKSNFVHESIKDKVAPRMWDHVLIKRLSLYIALAWAAALTVMAAAALAASIRQDTKGASIGNILCNYVFGITPIFIAFAAQLIIKRHYVKQLLALKAEQGATGEKQQHQGQPQQPAKAVGGQDLALDNVHQSMDARYVVNIGPGSRDVNDAKQTAVAPLPHSRAQPEDHAV